MEHMTDNTNDPCAGFLDRLDLWLAGELAADSSQTMQAHHDGCAACQLETRLARAIDAITAALPEQVCPELQVPVFKGSGRSHAEIRAPATRHLTLPGHSFIARLLAAWRQPLVFVPAFALVLATLLVVQFRAPADSRRVVIDGQEYSLADIIEATEDLEIALRYLDKYASYPARVVSAELEQSHLPLPPPANGSPPAI
jgi:hypothetical protein